MSHQFFDKKESSVKKFLGPEKGDEFIISFLKISSRENLRSTDLPVCRTSFFDVRIKNLDEHSISNLKNR